MCMLYIGFKILVLSPFFNATVQECKGTTQLFSVLQRQFERPQSRHMPREEKKKKKSITAPRHETAQIAQLGGSLARHKVKKENLKWWEAASGALLADIVTIFF